MEVYDDWLAFGFNLKWPLEKPVKQHTSNIKGYKYTVYRLPLTHMYNNLILYISHVYLTENSSASESFLRPHYHFTRQDRRQHMPSIVLWSFQLRVRIKKLCSPMSLLPYATGKCHQWKSLLFTGIRSAFPVIV